MEMVAMLQSFKEKAMVKLRILQSNNNISAGDLTRNIVEIEAATGVSLPQIYRRFLGGCNGGYPYPNHFIPNMPIEDYPFLGEGVFVSVFYGVGKIMSHLNKEVYGQGTPPNFIVIGNEPGGLELLMSLNKDTFGYIYTWFASSNIWGTDGNDASNLFLQNQSFEGFVQALSDTPSKDGLDFLGGEAELSRALTVDLEA